MDKIREMFESDDRLTQEVFVDLYQCSYLPDQRTLELDKRLAKYYAYTPDSMSNKVAYSHWREFKEWVRIGGYTSKEVNMAKYRVSQWLDDKPVNGECE